jgi:hypothetical protein
MISKHHRTERNQVFTFIVSDSRYRSGYRSNPYPTDPITESVLESFFQEMAIDLGPPPRFTDEEKRAIKMAIRKAYYLGLDTGISASDSCD